MLEWQLKTIKDLGKVVTGKTPSKENDEFYNDGELPFVSPKDLDWNSYYVYDTQTKVTDKAYESQKNQRVPKNSVFYTSLSFAIGKIGIASRESLTNQQIHSIVVNDNHDYKFVYYLLQQYRPYIFCFNSGIDTPIVPKSVFEKINVVVPDLDVQKKIAAILSAYDDLIENNKQRIQILENMAEELYKEWFVRFRFPNWENTDFEKGLPSSWDRTQLKYLCFEVKQSIKKEDLKAHTKYLGLEHLSRKDIAIYDYSSADTVDSNKLKFKKFDILFAKIRPYLHKVCLAHFDGICSSDTIVLRAKDPIYLPYILFTVFSETFIDLADVSSNGTKMPRANWNFLQKVVLSIPPNELMEKFYKICMPIFIEIETLLNQIEILNQQKDSLLPRLISGKLSVENLDIQFPPSMQEL